MAGFIRKYRKGRQRGDRKERAGFLAGQDALGDVNDKLDEAGEGGGGGASTFASAMSGYGQDADYEWSPDDIPAADITDSAGWPDVTSTYNLFASNSDPADVLSTSEGVHVVRGITDAGLIISPADTIGALDEFTAFVVVSFDDADKPNQEIIDFTGGSMLLPSSGTQPYWNGPPGTNVFAPTGVTIPEATKFLFVMSGRSSDNKRMFEVDGVEYTNTSAYSGSAAQYVLGIGSTAYTWGGKIFGFYIVDGLYMDSSTNSDALTAAKDYINGVHGL